jgi:hypothetical protein
MKDNSMFLELALKEAAQSLEEGGIPVSRERFPNASSPRLAALTRGGTDRGCSSF